LLLRFADELHDAKGLDLPSTNLKTVGVTPKELSMAERLIDGMVSKFEPEKYEDEYRRDLQRLIQRKAKAGELNSIPDAGRRQQPKATTVPPTIDLAELLAQSVHGAKRPPRAANQNDRSAPKSKLIKARAPRSKATKARAAKVHSELHHRKSA
jgi:DNA end-binding protein Ku